MVPNTNHPPTCSQFLYDLGKKALETQAFGAPSRQPQSFRRPGAVAGLSKKKGTLELQPNPKTPESPKTSRDPWKKNA